MGIAGKPELQQIGDGFVGAVRGDRFLPHETPRDLYDLDFQEMWGMQRFIAQVDSVFKALSSGSVGNAKGKITRRTILTITGTWGWLFLNAGIVVKHRPIALQLRPPQAHYSSKQKQTCVSSDTGE